MKRRYYMLLLFLAVLTPLFMSTGCATIMTLAWMTESSNYGKLNGLQQEKDGSVSVVYEFKGDPHIRDGLQALTVPAGWEFFRMMDCRMASGASVVTLAAPLWLHWVEPYSAYHGLDEKVPLLAWDAPGMLSPLPVNAKAPGRFGVVQLSMEDRSLSHEVYAFNSNVRRWVRLGRVDLGVDAKKKGRLARGAIILPFAMALDAGLVYLWARGGGSLGNGPSFGGGGPSPPKPVPIQTRDGEPAKPGAVRSPAL
jgi:hypothetical protein